MLTKQSDLWALTPHCRLQKIAHGGRGERLRDVFLNLNLSFATE